MKRRPLEQVEITPRKQATGLNQIMHDNPDGRYCSVCGGETVGAIAGIKASVCSSCTSKVVDRFTAARLEEKR